MNELNDLDTFYLNRILLKLKGLKDYNEIEIEYKTKSKLSYKLVSDTLLSIERDVNKILNKGEYND